MSATLACEALVIGTGAGGASMAATLAEAGVDVLMLEEGAHIPAAQAPAGRQQFEGGFQTCFKVLKLLIDENPDSLKGAGCRILAFLPGFDRVCHDCGKLSCA